jgi:hypothetical protein
LWLQKFREEAILKHKYSLVATNREERLFSYQDSSFVAKNLCELQQVQVNYPFRLNAFVFDIDNPQEFEALSKMPTFQTFNRDNNKSHLVYMLDKPFEVRNHRLKLDITRLFTQAKIFTHSDTEYRNITTKNPFNTKEFEVRVIGGSIQNLFTNFSQVLEVEVPQRDLTLFNFNYYSSSPNSLTFKELLIQWSKANTRLFFTDRAKYEELLFSQLDRVNAIVQEEYRLKPLGEIPSEDMAIKVIEFMDNASPVWRERFLNRQRFLGRRGGITSAQKKRELRERAIIQSFEDMRERGEKITVSKLAIHSGITRDNLYKHYRELVTELQTSLKKNKKIIV